VNLPSSDGNRDTLESQSRTISEFRVGFVYFCLIDFVFSEPVFVLKLLVWREHFKLQNMRGISCTRGIKIFLVGVFWFERKTQICFLFSFLFECLRCLLNPFVLLLSNAKSVYLDWERTGSVRGSNAGESN